MAAELAEIQQAQLAAILGPDPAPCETLLSHLMSSVNEQRSQAESIFNLIRQTHPESLALKLAQLVSSSPRADARGLSVILLRQQLTRQLLPRQLLPRQRLFQLLRQMPNRQLLTCLLLTRDDYYIWPRLPASTQATIKSVLLTSIQKEENKSMIKKLCDTVSELASSILPDNEWPEILPLMFQWVESNNPKLQESAFRIFSQLARNTLVPYIEDLHASFLQVLNHSPSSDVRIAALSAVNNFIPCLNTPSDSDRFQDLLPAMMRTTLTEPLNGDQEATAQEALKLLIELAGTKRRFLRGRLVYVVELMLKIAEEQSLEEGTRHLAIEFVITLVEDDITLDEDDSSLDEDDSSLDENDITLVEDDITLAEARAMMPQFISRLCAILMNMLLNVEDDLDAEESSNYSVGQVCLYRLAIALDGNTIVPGASEQLLAYLADPEWQKRHAGLIALAQIAEGCPEDLEQVVNMVLDSFQYPHPRVKCTTINAIVQLLSTTDLGPDLLVPDRVMEEIVFAMDDFQDPRMQAHVASAVPKCPPYILTGYLRIIFDRLLRLLEMGNEMVVGAMNALASLARSSPRCAGFSRKDFRRHMDAPLWGHMRNRLGEAWHQRPRSEAQRLLSECYEYEIRLNCVSYLNLKK